MTPKKPRSFDARAFLESAGLGKQVVMYARGDVIFSQGDPCDSVMYIRSGAIQLSVLSHAGREAIVGSLGPGDFLGEGALAGHPVRLATAKAAMASRNGWLDQARSKRAFASLPARQPIGLTAVISRADMPTK